MRKNALTILLVTLVLGVFGAFLRWLQTRNIFEEETGLAVPGAPISIIYVIYSLLALAAIAAVVLVWLRTYRSATAPAEAFLCTTAVPRILGWVLAAVYVLSALAALFGADGTRFPMFQRIFGAVAIFGGLCIPFVTPKRGGVFGSASRAASVILTLACCFWLVFAYKQSAESPVIWAYAPEMLALAATTLGVYEIAAFFHDRAKPVRTLVLVQWAAFLDLSVIFDSRSLSLTVMLGVCAALMLLTAFLLISNLKESGE